MTELPGIEWGKYSKPLEPHQMSPKQFMQHPNAVFHSTHLANPLDLKARQANGIHVGTLAAALERHGSTGTDAMVMPNWTKDATVHVYHLESTPEEREKEISDSDANLLGGWHPKHADPPVHYYRNYVEDMMSTSAIVRDPSRLKSHSDYVQEAIRNGKADEVHPITMAQHLTGNLGKWTQTLSDSLNRVGNFKSGDTQLFETYTNGEIADKEVSYTYNVHQNDVPHLGPDAERLGIKERNNPGAWDRASLHGLYEDRIAARNPAYKSGETPKPTLYNREAYNPEEMY